MLDDAEAAALLLRVFEQCEVTPNSVPLEVLTSYTDYRKERFTFQKVLLFLMALLFLELPLLFIGPKYSLYFNETSELGRPTYCIDIDNIMPVVSVTAVVDGQRIPVFEASNHRYVAEPSMNGEMTVTVTLVNKQYFSKTITVEGVDLSAPYLIDNKKNGDLIEFIVADDDSGIDYENIKGVTLSGREITPVSYDSEAGTVYFAFPEESINVFIPDVSGNSLQLVLTVQ